MDYTQSSYGVSRAGVENYVAELNSIVSTNVSNAVLDTSIVRESVQRGWHGTSADKFLASLDKNAEILNETLKSLTNVFQNEMDNIVQALSDMDNNLFDE